MRRFLLAVHNIWNVSSKQLSQCQHWPGPMSFGEALACIFVHNRHSRQDTYSCLVWCCHPIHLLALGSLVLSFRTQSRAVSVHSHFSHTKPSCPCTLAFSHTKSSRLGTLAFSHTKSSCLGTLAFPHTKSSCPQTLAFSHAHQVVHVHLLHRVVHVHSHTQEHRPCIHGAQSEQEVTNSDSGIYHS